MSLLNKNALDNYVNKEMDELIAIILSIYGFLGEEVDG